MYTRQRTRIIGRDPDAVEPRAPKALAPKALGREATKGGQGVPCAVWGSVAGSPDRQCSRGRDTFPVPTRG